jgi:hypothetical protein
VLVKTRIPGVAVGAVAGAAGGGPTWMMAVCHLLRAQRSLVLIPLLLALLRRQGKRQRPAVAAVKREGLMLR